MKSLNFYWLILILRIFVILKYNAHSDGNFSENGNNKQKLQENTGEINEKINKNINLDLENISSLNENKNETDAKILSFSEWKGINSDACDDDDNETAENANENISSNLPKINISTQSPSYQNYASKDCGARIISSNKESEHVNDALSYDLDAYALNPCYSIDEKGQKIRTSIYFVIQLCEKISISSFAISNGEIYSSNPKNIKLSYSVSHDSHEENEWHEVGVFVANDSKDLQTFKLHSLTRFTKVVKLEIIDHYENDPYCPITTIQFFGISIIDKLTFNPVLKSKSNSPKNENQKSSDPEIQKSKGLFSTLVENFIAGYYKFSTYGNIKTGHFNSRKSAVIPNNVNEVSTPEINQQKTDSDYAIFYPEEDRYKMTCNVHQFNLLKKICRNLTKMCPYYQINIPVDLQRKICSQLIPDSEFIEDNTVEEISNPENINDNHVSDFSFEFDPTIPNSIHILKIKIRDLRKNLSLTTKYLEDVSVKFRQAIEDLKRETNIQITELEKKNKFMYESMESLVEVITEQNRKIQLIIEHLYLVHEKNISIQEFNLNITWFLYFNAFITQIYFLYLLLNKLIIILKKLEIRIFKWFKSPKDSRKTSINNPQSVFENPKISLTPRFC